MLTACSTGLLVAVVLLSFISDTAPSDALALSGLLLLAAALGSITLDAWVPLRRPSPRITKKPGGTATVVPAPLVLFCAIVAAAVGFLLLVGSFLLVPGMEDVAETRRGLLVYLAAPHAPLLVIGALGLAIRPDRVVLTPDAVSVRGWAARARSRGGGCATWSRCRTTRGWRCGSSSRVVPRSWSPRAPST